MIYLSVVIPCFNEAENLRRGVLKEIYGFLKKQEFTWEIIISDDGSNDQSQGLIQKQIQTLLHFSYIKNQHGGKPSALLSGIKMAKGEYILFSDMDQSTPITELTKLIPFTKKGYDVVIGSRGLLRKNFTLYRKIGSIAFVTLRKTFILPEISDTQCGFKLFKKSVLINSFPKLEFFKKTKSRQGWNVTSYDVELLHIIKKMGYRIKEVTVVWEDRDASISKGGGIKRYLRESWEMLGQITRVELNELKGVYNK